MNKFFKVAGGVFAVLVLTLGAGAAYVYSQRDAMLQLIVPKAAEYASNTLGTKVEIGSASLGELTKNASDISVNDVVIYDRDNEIIARAERADVNFSPLGLYYDAASAIDSITVTRPEAFLVKREDGTWNFADIQTKSSGKSEFSTSIDIIDGALHAEPGEPSIGAIDASEINVALTIEGTDNISAKGSLEQLTTSYEGNPIELTTVDANVNYKGLNDLKAHVKAMNAATELIVDAALLGSRQTFYVKADRADVGDYLPFIPEGKIPEGVEILDGTLTNFNISVARQGDDLKFNGRAGVNDGRVRVEETVIEDINGAATFNNKAIQLNASLAANDQYAALDGTIRIDAETPYFDLRASSERFQPSAILASIPVDSVAAFTAHLTGTTDRPLVEADIEVPSIAYDPLELYASNITTHFKYFDNAVYLSDFAANTLGGLIQGDAELQASNYAFNAHLKTFAIDVARLVDYLPALEGMSGAINADLGINGVSDDLDQLKVYGSATAKNLYVKDIPIDQIDTSFYAEGDDIRIDYLSAAMPNHGSIGIEGTITNGSELALNFYGGHVDLAFVNNFIPATLTSVNLARNEPPRGADSMLSIAYAEPAPRMISGLSDFKGTIKGAVENPAVDLKFTAIDNSAREGNHFHGTLLNQPFDSVKFSAKGSLDEVSVNDFKLTKDGMDHWLAKGTVGLTGEQRINLQVDTVGARAEDIIDLVSPDQELTGNVDNIVKITGTLDKPEVVGYIHFWRGSYRGMLVNNMDGDYFVEGNTIRVQDFHINTPMIDMDLNGTIDKITTAMDFIVSVHDIDMQRLQGKFPDDYPVSGHGKFDGVISGTLNGTPIFDGQLTAELLTFNGVELRNVNGDVGLNGNDILLDNFSFRQGDGSYNVHGAFNYQSGTVNGASIVENAGIAELLALSNLKNNLLEGRLNSRIRFGGSMYNPSLNIVGVIPEGSIAGSPVRDLTLDVNLINHVAYINKLEGYQGEQGTLVANGTAALDGPLDITLAADNLSLDMFTQAAGLDAVVAGTASINAKVEGTSYDPIAHAELVALGSGKDPMFDRMHGEFDLKGGLVNVKNFVVQRADGEKFYQASAKGKVPFAALTAKDPSELTDSEQLDLTLALDNANLSLLPVLSEFVSWANGDMQGALKLTGTAAHPIINGKITSRDGSMKFKTIKSPIEHMNMTLDFSGNRMTIEQFDGMVGTGKYVLTGGFGFDGFETTDYDFKFVADKLMIKSEFFSGPLSMEFELNEDQFFRMGMLPKVTGHVDFDNCTVSVPTIPESDGELPHIILDVMINLGDRVHFYSPYLYDLNLDGWIHYEGSTHYPKPSGSINIKRGGTLNYLKTIFKIQVAEADFNQLRSFLPSVRFDAEAKLTQAKVSLHLDGTLDAMNFRLTSSPEMTQEEIIQLLTLRDAYQKGGDTELDAADLLTLGLQLSVLSEIEGAVRKTFGFDQFTISRGSGSAFDRHGEEHDKFEEEYNVQMGKYVTDNVMLKYTRGIGGDNINRYGFQYDFNNNLGMTVERENHDFILGVEARWKF